MNTRGEKMKWKWSVSVKVAGERRGTMALSGAWEVLRLLWVVTELVVVVVVGLRKRLR